MNNHSTSVSKRQSRLRTNRPAAGQAIVEGSAMLVILGGIVVSLILLVTDIGMTLSYQQKVTYLASQAAMHVAACENGWQYQNTGTISVDIDTFVKDLAENMGFPRDRITASVTPVSTATSNDAPVLNVNVSGSNLPLIAGLSFLPSNINVQQTLCANTSLLPRPTGLLAIEVSQQTTSANGNGISGNTVMVPCYSGWAMNDNVATRNQGDVEDPTISETPAGIYDQFSFAVQSSSGASMAYTPGGRGMQVSLTPD